MSYLAGIAAGGAYGLARAANDIRPGGKQAQFPPRLKINQLMNSMGKHGGQTANGFAVFGQSRLGMFRVRKRIAVSMEPER